MRFRAPKNLAFTCDNCGICCGDTAQKTRHILLTKKDAERITAHTNQETATFSVAACAEPYVFEMKKDPETGKCVFHQNNQCTIYDARPLICRFYPFQLTTTPTGTFVFSETTECPQVQICTDQKTKPLNHAYFKKLLQQAQREIGEST